MQTERLIIFLKAPRPGSVKTRLAQTMGDVAACAAYRALVGILTQRLLPLSNVELRFAPDDAVVEIQPWRQHDWCAAPQGSGDLGQRLTSAFQDAFGQGVERVVIIGSDCPEVTVGDIETAWAALRTHDLVLGPAADGGYWLIGLNRLHAELFTGITWSSASVLAETLERARAAKLRVQLLRKLIDVDTEAEWKQFLARTQSQCQ